MRERIEMAITFVFAGIGVWQMRTWMLAGLDRFQAYLHRRIEQRPSQVEEPRAKESK